jgi:hypothetical protein
MNSHTSRALAGTHNSTFKLSQTTAGLQFTAVSVACKEDGRSLSVAAWRKR